jgi:hypothetical protein
MTVSFDVVQPELLTATVNESQGNRRLFLHGATQHWEPQAYVHALSSPQTLIVESVSLATVIDVGIVRLASHGFSWHSNRPTRISYLEAPEPRTLHRLLYRTRNHTFWWLAFVLWTSRRREPLLSCSVHTPPLHACLFQTLAVRNLTWHPITQNFDNRKDYSPFSLFFFFPPIFFIFLSTPL